MVVTLDLLCQIWQSEFQVQVHAIPGWHSVHADCIDAMLTLADASRQRLLLVHDSRNI